MKKILLILFTLSLSGCYTHKVTTTSDFNRMKLDMLGMAEGYGYVLADNVAIDTTAYPNGDGYTTSHCHINERYVLASPADSLVVDLGYRDRAIAEGRVIPYISQITVGCQGQDVICDSIAAMFKTPRTSDITVMEEGSAIALFASGVLIPFLGVLGFIAVNNKQ